MQVFHVHVQGESGVRNRGAESITWNEFFPAPQDALKVVKNMDPRVGLCIDVGHTARTGVDVVQSIAEAGPRLLSFAYMRGVLDGLRV
jgi:sugar phosphate isomerase/epimerase